MEFNRSQLFHAVRSALTETAISADHMMADMVASSIPEDSPRVLTRYTSIVPNIRMKSTDEANQMPRLQPFRYRDLHFVDPALNASRKTVLLLRDGCLICAMPPYRAIICRSKCFVLLEAGMDAELKPLMDRVKEQKIRADAILQPFGEACLWAILSCVESSCMHQFKTLSSKNGTLLMQNDHKAGAAEVRFERLQ
jgi:hypothetical protein